jgi:predicted transcriptional regulator
MSELIMRINQKKQQYKLRFLDDKDHTKLKEVAKKEDRSLNYLINQAIKNFLNEENAKV